MRADHQSAGPNLESPKVSCSRDRGGKLRHIEHVREPVALGRRLEKGPTDDDLKELARKYLGSANIARGYDIGHYEVQLDAKGGEGERPAGTSSSDGAGKHALQLAEIRSLDEDTVLTVRQTFAGLQVWQAGVSLSIHQARGKGELVVTSSQSTLQPQDKIEAEAGPRLPGPGDRYIPERVGNAELAQALGVEAGTVKRMESRRLLIYRYEPDERLDAGATLHVAPLANYVPRGMLPLRDVPGSIRAGEYYVVTEVLFTTTVSGTNGKMEGDKEGPPLTLNWRVFVDLKTGTVLYLRAFVSGLLGPIFAAPAAGNGDAVRGSVFCVDPVTATSSDPFALPTQEQIDEALNNLRTTVDLPRISKNAGEWQFLVGEYAQINTETLAPFVPNPRARIGTGAQQTDFTKDVLLDPVTFTAVNAYYHITSVFQLMEKLGFEDVMDGYFHRTTVHPILIDPDGTDGAVNALVFGNSASNGVEKIVFGPMQPGNSQLGNGVGNASDVRVVLHEFCHTLLFAQLGSPNFGFAHSAGDSLAAILCDPDSSLRGDKVLRFQTFPWIASANQEIHKVRYHGGDVDGRDHMEQWGWRGTRYQSDTTGYVREQVLSMTLFEVYRALGGDSAEAEKRRLAALYTVYLLIKAISLFPNSGDLSSDDATVLATHMIETDVRAGKLKSEFFSLVRGGCAHKVIRWAFEKHGLYAFEPVPAHANEHSPGKGEGAPPMVDVYINDKDDKGQLRCGEYFPCQGYETTEIWNRTTADGGTGPGGHQAPVAGVDNYLFVRVRNRGCETAANVRVSAYFAAIMDGDEPQWDGGQAGGAWSAMTGTEAGTKGLTVARGDEVIAGPFTWRPATESDGRKVCVLASVSAPGDPSNLDIDPASTSPTYSEVQVPLWWLVPLDNNIGQRSMTVGVQDEVQPGDGGDGGDGDGTGDVSGDGGGSVVNEDDSGGNNKMADEDKDPNNPLGMEDWIDEVVDPGSLPEKLPAMPGNVVVLFGYLSDAERFATRDPDTGEISRDRTSDRAAYRLYRTPQLNDYLIIRHEDILHRGDISEGSTPYGGSILWIKSDAQVQYVYTQTMQAQASFLQGPFTGRGNEQYQQGGQAGGASFACGGGSFACGGGSFACGGGSFACGGGSFACGGGSFACGGGSFACGGGSFACGGGSFACGGGSFSCP